MVIAVRSLAWGRRQSEALAVLTNTILITKPGRSEDWGIWIEFL